MRNAVQPSKRPQTDPTSTINDVGECVPIQPNGCRILKRIAFQRNPTIACICIHAEALTEIVYSGLEWR